MFRFSLAVLQTIAYCVAATLIYKKTIVPATVVKLVVIGLVYCAAYLVQLLAYDWWWIYVSSRTVADIAWGVFYWYFAVEYYASSAQIEAKLLLRPKSSDGVSFIMTLERIVTVSYVFLIVGESASESVQYVLNGDRAAIFPASLIIVTAMEILCTVFMAIAIRKILIYTRSCKSVKTSRKVWFHGLLFAILTVAMIVSMIMVNSVIALEVSLIITAAVNIYLAERLIFLSNPLNNTVCPVGKTNNLPMITRIKVDQALINYIQQQRSEDEQRKIDAYRAYHELTKQYNEYLDDHDSSHSDLS